MGVEVIANGPVMLQEGKVRAKLAKILAGYDDVQYERSSPTAETIQAVCTGVMKMAKIDVVIA